MGDGVPNQHSVPHPYAQKKPPAASIKRKEHMTAKRKPGVPKRMTHGEITALAESMSQLCDDRVFTALAYLLAHAIIEADPDYDGRRETLEGHINYVDSLLDKTEED